MKVPKNYWRKIIPFKYTDVQIVYKQVFFSKHKFILRVFDLLLLILENTMVNTFKFHVFPGCCFSLLSVICHIFQNSVDRLLVAFLWELKVCCNAFGGHFTRQKKHTILRYCSPHTKLNSHSRQWLKNGIVLWTYELQIKIIFWKNKG